MKTSSNRSRKCIAAFTLIELLVVIAIIGILAAMLLPVLGAAKKRAQVGQAKIDMSSLGNAIDKYEADYNGRFPAPNIPTGELDVTYGYAIGGGGDLNNHISIATNSPVMVVLLDLENYPDGNPTINKGHVFNPRGLKTLSVKDAKDVTLGGLGPDGEYRDPWGNSYVISMDTSMNDHVRDNLYSRTTVTWNGSKVLTGLSTNAAVAINPYGLRGQRLIWSRGPDKQAATGDNADKGVNKDNVLSWQ